MTIRTFPLLTMKESDLEALIDDIYKTIPPRGTSDWWNFVRWGKRCMYGMKYGTRVPKMQIKAVLMAMKKIEGTP